MNEQEIFEEELRIARNKEAMEDIPEPDYYDEDDDDWLDSEDEE